MTVTWLSIKILEIQHGGRLQSWENITNGMTRLPIDRLERKLRGHIPSFPEHVRHYAVAIATTIA